MQRHAQRARPRAAPAGRQQGARHGQLLHVVPDVQGHRHRQGCYRSGQDTVHTPLGAHYMYQSTNEQLYV